MQSGRKEKDDCDCQDCVRKRRMNWKCRLGFHVFDKKFCGHKRSKYCTRCTQYVV